MEQFNDFYQYVSQNYSINSELKETKYQIPEEFAAVAPVDSDLIVYDDSEKVDTEMIKVEIINDNEQFDENGMEWIEEEKVQSSKKVKRIAYDIPKIPRQTAVLDSADDQRIKETAKMYCDICHETLESLREAKSHFKSTHGVEGYLICCERKFKQRYRLVEHVNTHYNYSYSCPVCAKTFDSKSYLAKHLACHDNNKQFVSLKFFQDID
jgi:hypothetical protein